jgi:hypothetical protein
LGCAVPIYGVRPEGVDESNETIGCGTVTNNDGGVIGDGGSDWDANDDAGTTNPGSSNGCGCRVEESRNPGPSRSRSAEWPRCSLRDAVVDDSDLVTTVRVRGHDHEMTRGRAISIAIFVLGATTAFALTAACSDGPCGGGEPSCFGPVLEISSPANDLVSAAGCGRSVSCDPSPCGTLWVATPIEGGVCVTAVELADGGTTNVTFDWGAAHPDQCCGTDYDHPGATITIGDASTD